MKSRTILCFLVLAVLGSKAPSHAIPQPKSNKLEVPQKEEISKAPMKSAEVKWRVLGLRHESTTPCPEVTGWQAEDWLAQTLRESRDQNASQVIHPSGRRWRQVVAAAPLLHDLGLDRFCAYTRNDVSSPPFPKFVSGLTS